MIQGVSLGPIADLGAPDGLLSFGGMSVNVLPILMTLVNVISAAIYLKGFPLKTKIQLYGMAGFFLVFLYTSPSGLVFYWTLNNVFSLVKTIFYKLKNPKKVLSILATIVGVAVLIFGIGVYDTDSMKRKVFVLGFGLLLQLPMLFYVLQGKIKMQRVEIEEKNSKKLFVLGGLFLTILYGGLIPSTLIAASPQEFIDITYFYNPVWYVVSALCLAAGFFLVWMGIFYWIASPKGKVLFDKIVWILCGITVANYMFFGTDLGIISKNLQYENGIHFTSVEMLQNLLVLIAIAAVMYLIITNWKEKLAGVILTAMIAIAGMSGMNLFTIQESVSAAESQIGSVSDAIPEFNLSTTGQNVIVLMLDRGVAQYVPYIMNENPKLKEQFDGFTYYSNTISFGACTNFGAPALFGGYEYTPVEMNKRAEESLVSKHNEALLMMPVLFSNNNYEVTVCDVPYANYQWIPDLSIYDKYPGIDAYITEGKFSDEESKADRIVSNRRNFFCFSLMKTMPLVIQKNLYEDGNYNQADMAGYQAQSSPYVANGISGLFMDSFSVLQNLSTMTNITKDSTNTFLMMNNNATHEQTMFQVPGYEISYHVDNTQFYAENMDLYTLDGVTLKMENNVQITTYQTNMAVLMQLGNWFDYMRANGVYDNTRIIIASDHGYCGYQIEDMIYDESLGLSGDLGWYCPLLLVKDFGSNDFVTSKEFMTQADIPTIAVDDLISNPINPFTGKEINNNEKYLHDQYVTISQEHDVAVNNGNVFLPGQWFAVSDNIWDLNNWRFIEEFTSMPEECK